MSTPAEGEWLYDTSRKAGVWGDGSEDDGIPAPNFAELVNNTWTGFTAVQNGSPADPNDLTITIDERFNKAAFLNGATFKTFARFYVKIPANNTGAVNLTVEFGSGGSTITKDLKKIDAAAAPAELGADDLVEGGIYSVVFDGTQWLVVGGLGGGGGGGEWEFIELQQASTDSYLDFTTGLTAYDDLKLVFNRAYGSGAGQLRLQVNRGAGLITSSYYFNYEYAGFGASTTEAYSSTSASVGIYLTHTGSDNRGLAAGECVILGADNATDTELLALWQSVVMRSGGVWSDSGFRSSGAGGLGSGATAGAVTALRVLPASGTIAQGDFSVWGRNHA